MTLPPVCILLLTYDRFEYAERTLRTALDRISYNGPLAVHIADDGSPEGYAESLMGIAGGYNGVTVGASDSQRSGYGANYNLALQTVHQHSEIVLPLEDDWELVRQLDLDPLVRDLVDLRQIDCIRLGYLAWTQPMRGNFFTEGERAYVVLNAESQERHVFAGHPRLETVEFERAVGPWSEELAPGATEFEVAGRRKARIHVAWPVKIQGHNGDWFAHFGAVKSTDEREAYGTVESHGETEEATA